MKQIILNFLKTDLDNLVWGLCGAAAVALIYFVTQDKQTVGTLGGAIVGICINKMRGKNGNGNSDEDSTETS